VITVGSIVVGTDGSATAERAVEHAAHYASKLGAKVHVVSAYEPSSVKVGGGFESRARWMASPDATVDSVLEGAAGIFRVKGIEVETYARKGDAAEALLEVAEECGADLIVVGNKGMTGARRFLLGSVPDKVSHHALCSVLIVRTTD
jgi:nucleotide-binding universal stress UspA family protein